MNPIFPSRNTPWWESRFQIVKKRTPPSGLQAITLCVSHSVSFIPNKFVTKFICLWVHLHTEYVSLMLFFTHICSIQSDHQTSFLQSGSLKRHNSQVYRDFSLEKSQKTCLDWNLRAMKLVYTYVITDDIYNRIWYDNNSAFANMAKYTPQDMYI